MRVRLISLLPINYKLKRLDSIRIDIQHGQIASFFLMGLDLISKI
jgi:hypothetical protein